MTVEPTGRPRHWGNVSALLTPTLDELQAQSLHLLNSIQMFGGTSRLIAGRHDSRMMEDDERITFHALIESNLIHARQLMRFLYPTRGKRPRDMAASDYLDDAGLLPTWPNIAAQLDAIDKQLAHLTFDRASEYSFAISHKLRAALLKFIGSVPEARVIDGFKAAAYKALFVAGQTEWDPTPPVD